ncbi:MAG TPA: alpha/beta fold hydrolase, partial [Myxococcota bacterium]|nr:alpha/beta fold hydrolase [Myxococcota bacterium]
MFEELPPARFPTDFPEIIDAGGLGKGKPLGGFGGDSALDREGHRAAVRRNPVILVHGNGGSSQHATWGMETLRDRLKGAGYRDCEIWALDYLGRGNTSASLPNPISENVDDLRHFVDQVRAYLGVDKVDIIGHSLG